MKLCITFLSIFYCSMTVAHGSNNQQKIKDNCDSILKVYESKYILIAKNYIQQDLKLDKSIALNPEVDIFFNQVRIDSLCFKGTLAFKRCILIILLKQYYYHLQMYHQGYDLLNVNTSNSKFIIHEFIKFSNIENENIEMLNSGYILTFIKDVAYKYIGDEEKELLKLIENAQQEIEENIFKNQY